MTYYAPDFANLTAGWYRTTSDPNYAVERARLDAVWSPPCDRLLEEFVTQYGTFFTAFAKQILVRAEDIADTSLVRGARYYEYYIANRVLELPHLRALWQSSYERELAAQRTWTCTHCGHSELLLHTHPAAIAREGIPPALCRDCFFAERDDPLKKYAALGSEILKRAQAALANGQTKRRCEYCSRRYHLANDSQLLSWGALLLGSYGNGAIEYLYPSLFVDVCPRCFESLLGDRDDGSEEDRLGRLRAFADFLNVIPTQDYANLSLKCRNRDEMLRFLSLLRDLRTPEGYRQEFGSFFAALVRAGVLPEGSRRMRLGTVTLARDGHVCLSLAERRIDDYLFGRGIPHAKEVSYPSAELRTDWEVVAPDGRRFFVEYFGLLSDVQYRRKAKAKRELAAAHGIHLVELTPKTDWEAELTRAFEGLFPRRVSGRGDR